MTVIFYGEGDHLGGFIGYRTARTIGTNEEYRQAYFSLNRYTDKQAYELAHKLDEEWRNEALEIRKINRTQSEKSWGVNIIAFGLRAYIGAEKNSKGVNLMPRFHVTRIGYGKSDIVYSMKANGYKQAYKLALTKYCAMHNIELYEHNKMLSQMPCKFELAQHFVKSLKERGHKVSLQEVLSKMP